MSIPVNTNGINEIDFNLGGTTSAVITSPGVVTVTNTPPIVVAFSISSGTVGSNVALYGIAPRNGYVTKCAVVVTKSDLTTGLTFNITQNGTNVFSANPSISSGVVAGSTFTFTALTSSPLSITQGDVFNMNITSGTGTWEFTAQLE